MSKAIQNQHRRGFLALGLSPVVNSLSWTSAARVLAVPSVMGAALAPTGAQAFPVAMALGVAASVCGMVASSKRGDGGMGAMMTASLEYQRVMTQQLSSIQKGLADVLDKVNSLPSEIRNILYEQRLRELQSKIGGCILLYGDEVRAASVFPGGYQAWTADAFVRQRLTYIANRLDESIADVSQNRWTDAVTSLYLPAALFTSLGLRTALGLSTPRLKFEAQKYLDLMARVEDSEEVGSAAADLYARSLVLKKLASDLNSEGFIVPEAGNTEPIEMLVDQVVVQDYSPPYQTQGEKCGPEKGGGGGGRGSVREGGGGPDNCWPVYTNHPERIGASEAFTFTMKVNSILVKDPKQPSTAYAIRQFLPSEVEVKSTFNTGQTVHRTLAGTSAARLAASRASPSGYAAEVRATRTRAFLLRHNEEVAYSALDIGALAALRNARRDVFGFFGMEQ